MFSLVGLSNHLLIHDKRTVLIFLTVPVDVGNQLHSSSFSCKRLCFGYAYLCTVKVPSPPRKTEISRLKGECFTPHTVGPFSMTSVTTELEKPPLLGLNVRASNTLECDSKHVTKNLFISIAFRSNSTGCCKYHPYAHLRSHQARDRYPTRP